MLTSGRRAPTAPSVLLVSMPWTTLTEPALGLGILKAVLQREGIPCRALHVNMFLLQHLQAQTYELLSIVYALNDFLFSGSLDPVVTNVQQRWLREKVRDLLKDGVIDHKPLGGSEGVTRILLRLRAETFPAWLEGWADEIAKHEAPLIGFTCMFDQTIASLALARMVRERAPHKLLALGGVAVRTPTAQMILRSSPWIDAVCDGEGEVTVLQLARAAAGEVPLEDVPGIVFRSTSGEPVSTPAAPQADLDSVPIPDYDDFFADLRRLSKEHLIDVQPPDLPIENSRGCWWGARSHCVFCGIRSEDMAYRARDAGTVMRTMGELSRRHGIDRFRFSDYILPIQYFDSLLPELARMGSPYRLSSEAKANISEERFNLLARAGFHEIQLGIESFSSDVLRKMRKGVTAAQNVLDLVLGRRLGIHVLYNIIYGFPDDELAEYERMAAQLPRLVHLDPPTTCVPVQITRFAPLHMQPARFGIDAADPEPCYDLIFSRQYLERTGFDMRDFCYYFERPFENAPRLQRIYEQLNATGAAWREVNSRGAAWLYAKDDGDGLVIHDRRLFEHEKVYRLAPSLSRVLLQCARPISLRALQETNPSLPEVDGLVTELDQRGLLFRDESRLVSLVLDRRASPASCPLSDERAEPSLAPEVLIQIDPARRMAVA
jgi:ribosomal peptide maturation radical SAM protein 1